MVKARSWFSEDSGRISALCSSPFSLSSGASGPEPSEVRILPGGEDPDTKDGTPRMVSGRRAWEMGISLRFSSQNNLDMNFDLR